MEHPGIAYALAKQAALVLVRAAAPAWAQRSARINSLSPGTIVTPMGRQELDSPHGEAIRAMISRSPFERMGTPAEIAAVAGSNR